MSNQRTKRYVDDVKIEIFPSLTALPGNEKGLTLQKWINERKKAYLVGYQKEVQIGEYEGVEIQDLGLVTWRNIFLTITLRFRKLSQNVNFQPYAFYFSVFGVKFILNIFLNIFGIEK